MSFDWIEFHPIGLDSIESNQIKLERTGLSAVHWMLFHHGLGEFLIVGFLRFEIRTGDILLPRLGWATDPLSLGVF